MEDTVKITKQAIERYKEAVIYLDGCETFDFDTLKEAHRIAGTEAQESQLSEMWSDAKLVLSGPDNLGGVQSLRKITRDAFTAAIDKFQELVEMMEKL